MNTEESSELARKLVDLFFPLVELTVLEANGTIREIFNPFSSLKQDQECDVKNTQSGVPFPELLAMGRTTRTFIHPLYKNQKVTGYLRFRFDLTHFKNLQHQLHLIVNSETDRLQRKSTDKWMETIDQAIAQFYNENQINVHAATSKQKRELIAKLQENGLFDFKESSAYIASKLQISRATVYNYLKTAASLKKIRVHQVDAFTNKKFSGNPAGVVLDAAHLNESTMRKITRELNLSETVFVLPSEEAMCKMRYFTPTGSEITFCGHSTVGALYMIAKERRFGIDKGKQYMFDVETSCGIQKMEIFIDEMEEIRVAYESPEIKLKEAGISHQEFATAAGINEEMINTSLPIMYEETNKDLFVVVQSLEDLQKIECDPKQLSHFSKQHDLIAICLFSPNAIDPMNQFHMRCFAPRVGIAEDPFTGSVLGGLTATVDRYGMLPQESRNFRVEQGHFMERPGVVNIEYTKEDSKYHAKIFAQAVHCFSTEINLL